MSYRAHQGVGARTRQLAPGPGSRDGCILRLKPRLHSMVGAGPGRACLPDVCVVVQALQGGHHAGQRGRRDARVQRGGDEQQVGLLQQLHVHAGEAVEEGLGQALASAALLQDLCVCVCGVGGGAAAALCERRWLCDACAWVAVMRPLLCTARSKHASAYGGGSPGQAGAGGGECREVLQHDRAPEWVQAGCTAACLERVLRTKQPEGGRAAEGAVQLRDENL